MPENAPAVKVKAVQAAAENYFYEPRRYEMMTARVQAETGAVLIHPYDDGPNHY